MEIPSEITKLTNLINSGSIWIYLGILLIFIYLLISLLTWSFKKPLKYLGIPTIIVGILFIIARFMSNLIMNFLDINNNIIEVLLPNILKPILINGIICTLIGIIMITIYIFINKRERKEKDDIPVI